jgi:hypothetical protein
LIKAGHGLIENNIIDNGHSGVTVNSECDLTAISDLTIRNNTIIGTGHFMPASWSNQAGAISFADGSGSTLAPAGSFDRIVIENNRFSDVSGVNMVFSSTNNLKVKGNVFRKTGLATPNYTGSEYGIDQNSVVYIKNCNAVVLDSNAVVNRELSRLLVTTGVTNLTTLQGGVFDVHETAIPYPVLSENKQGNIFYHDKTLVFRTPKTLHETIHCFVYNSSGQLERRIQFMTNGNDVTLPYQPVGNGIKLVRIESESFQTTGKIIVSNL